ncbi:zinc metalloproteinase nas-13-like isoform X3 [Rhopilema esculentum]|uniref:zinc metalloproteinase nas-13-like isoform X3 n=1 Tax=Rhopilema esculentum TaxID=499914 RepID=UPI0031DAEEC2|eukprot:gene1255-15635_t
MAALLALMATATLLCLNIEMTSGRPGKAVFEGDMAFTTEQIEIVKESIKTKKDIEEVASVKYAATNAAFPKWTNAIMPYTLSSSLSSRARYAIKQGMDEWEGATCIRFKKRTTERSYVEFFPGSGCWGHVGMTGGKSQISVGPGCEHRHVMTHEIGHALGFFHEQSRTDRDSYVTIVWNNVPKNLHSAFEKYGRDKLDSLGEPYDYGSIMHYPWNAFSTNGRNTLVPKRRVPQQPYVRLSKSDAIQASRMYKCGKTKPEPATKPPVPTGPVTKPPVPPVTKCVEVIVEKIQRVPFSGNICADRHGSCRNWARRGECRRNPAYMRSNCCRSCGSGGSCSDKNSSCGWWARRGECRRNPGYMNINCKKSCGKCSTKKVIKKKVRKCTVVPTEGPITPPIPTDEPITPPIPTDEPITPPIPSEIPPVPTDVPATKIPPLSTAAPPVNKTDKPTPPVTLPPVPSACNIYNNAGLEDGSLVNENLAASTSYSKNFDAAKARLGNPLAWCSGTLDEKQYLQIDIGNLSLVDSVMTQGLDTPVPHFVKKFYVSYSEDNKLWNNVVGASFWAIKEFEANKDGKSKVKNEFKPPIVARYIKIHPIEWENHICLRAELKIC